MTENKQSLLTPEFLQKLEQLGIFSRKIFRGHLKGERMSKKKGDSIEFADYRDYVPGDDLRFLDWNIYSRLERLFIKLFLEEEDLNVYILIDASESMDFGEPSKLLYSKRVAAALGYIALTNLDRVGIGAFHSNLSRVFPLTRGKGNVWRLFEFLDGIKAQGETGLALSCKSFAFRNRRKGIAIIISDFLDPAGYEDALKFFSVQQLDLFVIHVLSQEEMSPPVTGDLRLLDSESGVYTDISVSEQLLTRYKRTLRGFLERIKEFCRSHGCFYLFSTTDVSFEDLILKYLRRVGLLR